MIQDVAGRERWPPVYDAAQLAKQISDLSARNELIKRFYSHDEIHVPWCQGDVIDLPRPFIHLDDEGMPASIEELDIKYWLLVSNTCDLARDMATVRWANLVPLLDVDSTTEELEILQQYSYSRQFYIPSWDSQVVHRVAQFTMPVAIDRVGLDAHGKRVARMSKIAWFLFHSCLVRYLARDDGRLD